MSRLEKLIQELCPDGVEYKRLGNACDIKRGIRVVRSQLKTEGEIPAYQNSLTPMGFHGKSNCPAETPFIIVAGAAGDIGYSRIPFWAADDCFYFDCSKSLSGRFLYHVLLSNQIYLYSKVRKASIPRLARNCIEDLKIPVPPLPVQSEIVQILDNFTELTVRKKQYEYYRDMLIQNAAGDRIRIIDMLAQPITDGPHTTPTFVEAGVPFVSVDSVWDGKIHFEKMRGYITEEFDLECCKKYKPQKHDIYMVKSGSTTGKVAYVDTDIRFNIWSPLAAMRVNEKNSSRYLYHLLQTGFIQEQVRAKSSHGSQPNLSMRTLEQFQVRVPPLEDQEKIVAILDRFDNLCNDLTSGLPAEIKARQKQYEYYRDKLLTFKGMTT